MPTQKQHQQDQDQDRERTGQDEPSLKEREYRGPDGQIHHHTKKYMEQHEGEQGKQGKQGKEE